MISRTLRLAYRLMRIAALEDRIQLLAKKYPKEPEARIRQLAGVDPTGGQYLEWLIRQDLTEGVNLDSGLPFVTKLLAAFDKVKRSPVLLEAFDLKPDINKYSIFVLDNKLARVVYGRETLESKTERMNNAKKTVRVLFNDPPYKVISIGGESFDPEIAAEAACLYARNTKWCTSDVDKAKSYLTRGPLFIAFKGAEKLLQANDDGSEIQDELNARVKWTDETLLLIARSGLLQIWADKRFSYKSPDQRVFEFCVYTLDLNLTKYPGFVGYLVEHGLTPPPMKLVEYVELHNLGRWPAAEPVIAADPKSARTYAEYVIGDRWPEGEPAIMQVPLEAYRYAKNVMERRWPEAEPYIRREPKVWEAYRTYFEEQFHAGEHDPRDRQTASRRRIQPGPGYHPQGAGHTTGRVLRQ